MGCFAQKTTGTPGLGLPLRKVGASGWGLALRQHGNQDFGRRGGSHGVTRWAFALGSLPKRRLSLGEMRHRVGANSSGPPRLLSQSVAYKCNQLSEVPGSISGQPGATAAPG